MNDKICLSNPKFIDTSCLTLDNWKWLLNTNKLSKPINRIRQPDVYEVMLTQEGIDNLNHLHNLPRLTGNYPILDSLLNKGIVQLKLVRTTEFNSIFISKDTKLSLILPHSVYKICNYVGTCFTLPCPLRLASNGTPKSSTYDMNKILELPLAKGNFSVDYNEVKLYSFFNREVNRINKGTLTLIINYSKCCYYKAYYNYLFCNLHNLPAMDKEAFAHREEQIMFEPAYLANFYNFAN